MMAEAMISGLIRMEVEPQSLLAAGPRAERLEQLTKQYGIGGSTDNAEVARQADVVVLAVKPQRMDKVLIGLCGGIRSDALVLSIVAGASIRKISRGLEHQIVVRSMPNTPAQIAEGITVWTDSPDDSPDPGRPG
jgi:pyrroline-5-carboxylate reductase